MAAPAHVPIDQALSSACRVIYPRDLARACASTRAQQPSPQDSTVTSMESPWPKGALLVVRYSALSFGVRSLVLLQAALLLILSLLVGVVVGLVRREVRRFNIQWE